MNPFERWSGAKRHRMWAILETIPPQEVMLHPFEKGRADAICERGDFVGTVHCTHVGLFIGEVQFRKIKKHDGFRSLEPAQDWCRVTMSALRIDDARRSADPEYAMRRLFEEHDFHYAYSDDRHTLRVGREQWAEIKALMGRVPPARVKELWKLIAPGDMTCPVS